MKIKPTGGPGNIGLDELDAVTGKDAAGKTGAADAAGPISGIDAIVEAVRTGELKGPEAVNRIMEHAMDQAKAAGLDATRLATLREQLDDLVANDPYLKSLVSRLGG